MDQEILTTARAFPPRKCILLSIAMLTLLSVVFFLYTEEKKERSALPVAVDVRGQRYSLEIADTDRERSVGLGGRDELCDACGMLFIFPSGGQYAFWMKDMRFPIDIVWLFDSRVVFVEHDVRPDFSDVLRPSVYANRVMEINAGVGQYLDVGDSVHFVYE